MQICVKRKCMRTQVRVTTSSSIYAATCMTVTIGHVRAFCKKNLDNQLSTKPPNTFPPVKIRKKKREHREQRCFCGCTRGEARVALEHNMCNMAAWHAVKASKCIEFIHGESDSQLVPLYAHARPLCKWSIGCHPVPFLPC